MTETRIEVETRSVVLLTGIDGPLSDTAAQKIYNRLDCDLLIVLKPGEDFSVLDEHEMNALGWGRLP